MECLARILTWATDFVQSDAISGSSSSAGRYAQYYINIIIDSFPKLKGRSKYEESIIVNWINSIN